MFSKVFKSLSQFGWALAELGDILSKVGVGWWGLDYVTM